MEVDEDGKFIINLPEDLSFDMTLDLIEISEKISKFDNLRFIGKWVKIKSSPEGLYFAVNNLLNAQTQLQFNKIYTIFREIIYFDGFLNIKPPKYDNPEQIVNMIIDLLFFAVENQPYLTDPVYIWQNNRLRVSILFYLYHIGDTRATLLLQRYLEELQTQKIFDFLKTLREEVNNKVFSFINDYNAIFALMAADGTQENYLRYILDKINNGVVGSLSALSYLLEILDTNFLSQFPLVDALKELILKNPENVEVLQCINSLYLRDPENIPEYIVGFNMKEYLSKFLKNPTLNKEIFEIVRKNIELSLISDDIMNEYFSDVFVPALYHATINYRNDHIFFRPFIFKFIKIHPELVETFTEVYGQLFQEVFTKKDMLNFEFSINAILMMLRQINTNARNDFDESEEIIPILEQIIGQDELIQEEEIAVRGVLKYYNGSDRLSKEKKLVYMELFSGFMDKEIISESRCLCYKEYLEFILGLDLSDENTQQYAIKAFIGSVKVLFEGDMLNKNEGLWLASILTKFIEKEPSAVEMISNSLQDILVALLSQEENEYIKLSAAIANAISHYEEDKVTKNSLFETYINKISEFIRETATTQVINIEVSKALRSKYKDALTFILSIDGIENAECIAAFFNFLNIVESIEKINVDDDIPQIYEWVLKVWGLEMNEFLISHFHFLNESPETVIKVLSMIIENPQKTDLIAPILAQLITMHVENNSQLITMICRFFASYMMNYVPQEEYGNYFRYILKICSYSSISNEAMLLIFPIINQFFDQGFQQIVMTRFETLFNLFWNKNSLHEQSGIELLKLFLQLHRNILRVDEAAFNHCISFIQNQEIADLYVKLVKDEIDNNAFMLALASIL